MYKYIPKSNVDNVTGMNSEHKRRLNVSFVVNIKCVNL